MTLEPFRAAAVLYRFPVIVPIAAVLAVTSFCAGRRAETLRRGARTAGPAAEVLSLLKWILGLAAWVACPIVAMCTFPIAVRTALELLEVLP
jgi:hypothetical protein